MLILPLLLRRLPPPRCHYERADADADVTLAPPLRAFFRHDAACFDAPAYLI